MISLIIGTYNSIPIGYKDDTIEERYQASIKPFLSLIYENSNIPVTLHYSGILLEWFDEKHPEVLILLSEMVRNKSVEILGGGYYDPILPLIPVTDRVGQIEYLTTFIRKKIGKRPRGGWITERVWETNLALTLKNNGIDFIFLDDWHLNLAGLNGSSVFQPYITEEQGKGVLVFPISNTFTSQIGTISPAAMVDHIVQLSAKDDHEMVVIMMDGLSFSSTSKSNNASFAWLQEFFIETERHKESIDAVLPGVYARSASPRSKVYFPSAMRREISSLPFPIDQQAVLHKLEKEGGESSSFLRAGYFRQFLSKYHESNLLYAKMMYVYMLVNQIRGDRSRKKTAKYQLWKGQCNSAYWHGPSGCLYRSCVRKAAYSALIEAEKITRERGIFKTSLTAVDIDMDGGDEFLYQGQTLNAYTHRLGGVLFELDYLPRCWNFLDTMTRYRELEHDTQHACFDTYHRSAFIDHFMPADDTIEAFASGRQIEQGNFIEREFEIESLDRDHKEITFVRDGNVVCGETEFPVRLQKKYIFRKNFISIHYGITNDGVETLESVFGSEVNLSFNDNRAESLKITVGEEKELDGLKPVTESAAKTVRMHDRANRVLITITGSKQFDLWSLPIYSNAAPGNAETPIVSRYQSTCVVPRWHLRLEPQKTWTCRIMLRLDRK
jgi:4-alpha-glucanotransferase